jgi:DNA-binding beta-propeller fold protein YncE
VDLRSTFRRYRIGLAVAAAAAAIIATSALAPWGAKLGEPPTKSADLTDFSAATRYVFVIDRSSSSVPVIDKDVDRLVGRIDAGLTPSQLVVSDAVLKLVAIDGFRPVVSIVDLKTGAGTQLQLGFVPQRLVSNTDGYLVAAASLDDGIVASVDLARNRVVARLDGLSALRDVMFGADGAFLYVVAEGMAGVGVIDARRGKLVDRIEMPGRQSGELGALTRSPSGRIGYVKARGNATVSTFDLANFKALRDVKVGRDAAKAFPTGTGGYLVVPDNAERTVTIVSEATLTIGAMLPAGRDMTSVYSGWFDTLALVPSASDRKLYMYDLDRIASAGDISLPGPPGLGAVTQDGGKLYLAIASTGQIAVVDLRSRKLERLIKVSGEPVAAVMSRSFDVCH